jgi:hypothetical protein
MTADRLIRSHRQPSESDVRNNEAAMKNLESMAKKTGNKRFKSILDSLKSMWSYADSISSQKSTMRRPTLPPQYSVLDDRGAITMPLEYSYSADDMLLSSADLSWTLFSDRDA